MSIITIVGAGMMGSAMSIPARDNGHEVRIVGTPLDRSIIDGLKKDNFHVNMKRTLPEGIKYYQIENLNEALLGADLLIGGVSSFGVDWFSENVLPLIPESLPVISITKGLHLKEDNTLITFPQLYKERLHGKNLSLNAIGGPCTSYELADRNQTEVAFCGDDIKVLKGIKKLLSTPYYHITTTTDVCGIETAVALKNAYALGVSLAIGLTEQEDGENCKEKYNPEAGLFMQSTREMSKIIELMKGRPESLAFGTGDLYVTIFGGRTRKIGTLLGRGMKYKDAKNMLGDITLESVVIATTVMAFLRELYKKGIADINSYPLIRHIDSLINEGKTVDIPWESFEE